MSKQLNLTTFDYNDVMLVPGQCKVSSRGEVNVEQTLSSKTFKLPVIPANMSTVISEDLAIKLAKKDYFYVMHRFNVDPIEFTKNMHWMGLYSSISIGVQEADWKFVETLKETSHAPEYITVDIAHGDTERVYKIIQKIKEYSPNTYVIGGNVATPEAVVRLENAGADGVKVGVAPGYACLTGPNTGFGSRGWQLSAIKWCSEAAVNVDIIADGGIKEYGDIAKSIALGADFVMVGSMLAAHDESPANTVIVDGKEYKEYFGSASAQQKGDGHHVEGRNTLIESKGSIFKTLTTIEEHLQSSVSYAGGRELKDLYNCNYVIIK